MFRMGQNWGGERQAAREAPDPVGASRVAQLFLSCLSGPAQPRDRLDGTLGQPSCHSPKPGSPSWARPCPLFPTGALQIESSEETDQGKYEVWPPTAPAQAFLTRQPLRAQVGPPRLLTGPPSSSRAHSSWAPAPCRPQQAGPTTPGGCGTLGEAVSLSGPQFLPVK